MSEPSDEPLPAAVRVQILATEHWSLLATRGMTWSEIMSRISIYLTVASASLVVLALVAQTSGYESTAFRVLSIGLASVLLLLGTLTGLRVANGSHEDQVLVLGMNRLRAAYLAIDPSLAQYLVTDWHDDARGALATYTVGIPRSLPSHVLASTSMFVNSVNTVVAGALGALVASAAGAPVGVVVVVGVVCAVAYLGVMVDWGRRRFAEPPIAARFPYPSETTP
jgi:hypothetical protein